MTAGGQAVDGRHAVGARNAEAILDAALEVLGEDPGAGLAEVAARAGVGRATVYRHFASREVLIAALRARAAADLDAVVAEAVDAGAQDGIAGIRALVEGLFHLGGRYAAVVAPRDARAPHPLEAALSPFAEVVDRARGRGQLDASVSTAWALASLRGLLAAAGGEIRAGRLTRAQAPERVVGALLHGIGAPPA